MLTFLSPTAFWALTALGLPLALHLWRRPPRTVKLGSLRYLDRLTRRRPRDLRWHELLLLAVRLLLLALLVLMLSRPHWRPAALDRPQRWILLDPVAAPAGESLNKLHTWQKDGYETRRLAAGFPPSIGAATGADQASSAAPDLWSLLREADAGLPSGSKLAVFTPGRLASLRGERPAISRRCQIDWVITPERGSVPPVQATAPRPQVRPITVLIVHDNSRIDDSRYLAAAVRAVAQVSGGSAQQTDWAFWLANEPVPEALAGRAKNLVTDAADSSPAAAPDTILGWILPQTDVPFGSGLPEPIRLWRRVPATMAPNEAILWTDGFGRPLLTRSGDGLHSRWRFFSRFNPAWTELPRTTALPAWLRSLLMPATNPLLFADPIRDLRLADPAQFPLAAPRTGTPDVLLPLQQNTPGLQGWCWLGAAILFCLERILSHRRRQTSPVPGGLSAKIAEPELAR
jgi:hypothetical protein